MRTRVTIGVLAGFALLLPAASLAQDLAVVEKKIAAAADKTKTISAKVTLTSQMQMGDMSATQNGEGTFEMSRAGDKTKARQELKVNIARKVGDEETKFETTSIVVADGEFAWRFQEIAGQKQAVKQKPDPLASLDPKGVLDQLKKTHELKLLPDDTVGDRKVFVIDAKPIAKPDAPPPSPLGHATFAFDQERGIITRVVTFGPDDKPVTTMTFTEVKVNEPIDPKRFEFVTPEGTHLIDQTLPMTPPTRPSTGPATTAPVQE